MTKKTVSFFLFGLLTAILAATSVVLFFIDWNQYRGTLAQLASERLGVQVELAGNLSLNLLPRPTVSARAVRLSPGIQGFNETIATADQIAMRLGFAGLLRGDLELQSLSLDGISATLLETDQGWTLEGWPVTEQASGGGQATTLLSLSRFRVQGGAINVRPLGGRDLVFEGLDLSFEGELPTGPLDWEGSAFLAGEPLATAGRIVPTRTEGETSVRAEFDAAGSRLELSGRLSANGDAVGRLRTEGADLAALADFLTRAGGIAADVPALPALAFGLDIQIDRENGISRLISRQLSIGQTGGSLDLTLAEQGGTYHLTGTTALGVVALDEWLPDAAPAASDAPVQAVSDDSVAAGLVPPLAGAIDVSVEAVAFRGKQVQQVEATVALSEARATLSRASALLPGASRVAYARRDDGSAGTLRFMSGGLPEIFDWIELPLSDAVPAGRLTTADLTATASFADDAWILSDISGTIDTSTVSAELSGTYDALLPNAVRVQLDQLNLDAYWPESKLQRGTDDAGWPDLAFDLQIDSLRWLSERFQGVRLTGTMAAGRLVVSDMALGQGNGAASGSVSFTETAEGSPDLEAAIAFSDWERPILKSFAPEAEELLQRFAGDVPVSGSLTMSGPVSDLQTRLLLNADTAALDVAGSARRAADQDAGWGGRFQGTLRHEDIARLAGVASVGRPLETALNMTVDGTRDTFSFTAIGDIGGGQADVSGEYRPDGFDASVSLIAAAGTATDLDALLRARGIEIDPSVARRMRATIALSGDDWRLRDLDARNGGLTLAGEIGRSGGALDGALALRNLDIGTVHLATTAGGSVELPAERGSVALALENISWLGQSFDAPAAQVTIDAGAITLAAGEGATLNGAPLVMLLDYNVEGGAASALIEAAAVDIASLSSAVGATTGFSGQVSAELSLTADASRPGSLVDSLAGEGRFEGGAGSMYFMAVPDLVRAIGESRSVAEFLQGVGGFLRNGQTDFAMLRGAFRLDSGVALVDEVRAEGDWGALALDGQVNIPADFLSMSGALSLTRPVDAPDVPVTFEGQLTAPDVRWSTRPLERFAIAGVERRLRTRLFGELEAAEAAAPAGQAQNPGTAVFQAAVGLLAQLRAQQEARRRAAEEAETNPDQPNGAPDSGTQRP